MAERTPESNGTPAPSGVVSTLTATLSPVGTPQAAPDTSGLVAVVSVLAKSLGRASVTTVPHAESRLLDPLTALAEASQLRVRPVTLGDRWWRAVEAPMVAFDSEGRPVGILPSHRALRRAAMVVDPDAGTTRTLTPGVARTLSLNAHELVADPDVTSAQALTRWSFTGLGLDVVSVAVLGLLGGLLGLALPVATAAIFSEVVPLADRSRLVGILVGLGAATVAAMVLQIIRGVSLVRGRDRFDDRFQSAVMVRLLSLPTSFFRSASPGELAEDTLAGSRTRSAVLTDNALITLVTGVFALTNAIVMVAIDPGLGAAVIGVAAVLVAVRAEREYRLALTVRPLLAGRARLTGLVLQFVDNIVPIRMANASRRVFTRWADVVGEQAGTEFERLNRFRFTGGLDRAFPTVATVVVIVGALQLPAGGLSAGEFTAFYVAFLQFLVAIVAVTVSVIALLEAGPSLDRSSAILAATPENGMGRLHPGELHGAISITDVVFRYEPDGPPILDGLSVHIDAGEYVAVVGPSGSGKSTLLRLLLGFIQPESGSVRFDGQELNDLDLSAVRRQFGVVLQDGVLFDGSILDAVAGGTTVTYEAVTRAVERAGLGPDVARMPDGLATPIGPGGALLSGGQRQRLIIARALVTEPSIVLFDEATSALDNLSQSVVTDSIAGLAATRIVVAHRLSTIAAADRVIVIDRGRVVEDGTPDHLRSLGGVFARLAARQTL